MKKLPVFFLFLILCSSLNAHENGLNPFKLKNYSMRKQSDKNKFLEISLEFEFLASGKTDMDFHSSGNIEIISGTKTKLKIKSSKGEISIHKWITRLPEDGYHFIEVGLRFFPDPSDDKFVMYAESQAFLLYYEVKDGELINTSLEANKEYTKPEVTVNRFPNEPKLSASYVPFDSTKHPPQSTIITSPNSINNYSILIQVSGFIKTQNALNHNVGIPDVAVYLDWDYDNNANTGYTPYTGGGTQHVDYSMTNMNGYYYFSFIFNSPYPANYYSSRIRVSANCANSGGYNLILGQGAKFPNSYYIDISSATDNVFSGSADLVADSYNGVALRYIYRAKVVAINEFGVTSPRIGYIINTGMSSSYFACPGDDGRGYNIDAPRIVFNKIIQSETGYHEYGHYMDWAYASLEGSDYTGSHWFTKQTTSIFAWVEGWAEFYNAAAHMYWYAAEQPSTIEFNREDYDTGDKVYQFLDYSQNVLPSSTNNTQVEGAVACFLYNLWDNVNLRAPGYNGDNDDISYSGNYILSHLISRYDELGRLRGNSQIEGFKNGFTSSLSAQSSSAINVLYNAIILRSGIQHSATPTSLNISGNSSSRVLSWNDNTSPGSVSYSEEDYPFYHSVNFDIFENQETGFNIYRKATTGSWNGTLSGYTLVASVPANQTTWSDNTVLGGQYSYVVVAYNSGGESIPKAEFTISYPIVSPVISGFTQTPSVIYLEQSGTVTCNLSQGNGELNYIWTYANKPSTLSVSFSGNTGYFTNSLAKSVKDDRSPELINAAPFSISCTVSNNAGSSSATYYPQYSTSPSGSSKAMITNNVLYENYPNPFNPSTSIKYQITEAGRVKLKVFDILGNEVATLVNEMKQVGLYEIIFDASDFPSGTYIYTILTENFRQTKKMLLIK